MPMEPLLRSNRVFQRGERNACCIECSLDQLFFYMYEPFFTIVEVGAGAGLDPHHGFGLRAVARQILGLAS